MQCLWDTDIVSEYLKGKNPHVVAHARSYFAQNEPAYLSSITCYEILRGLKAKRATAKLGVFARFCQQNVTLSLNDVLIDIAADVWAGLQRGGQPIGDLDPLIAATALHHGLVLVTRNVPHFKRIPGRLMEDWTKP